MGNGILTIVQVIIALLLVLALAYISLRFINKWMKKQYRFLNIIEKVSVTNQSYLAIVKVGDKHYLMSFSNTGNNILKELEESMVKEMNAQLTKESNISLDINQIFGKRK